MATPRLSSAEIKIGAFSTFVKLCSVVESDESPYTRVHLACTGRLKQQTICDNDGCEGHGKIVPREDWGKLFTHPSGAEVVFTDEELKDLQIDRTDAIEIEQFVSADTLNPLFLGRAFFVAPGEEPAPAGYALLVDALKTTGTVGIGRWHKGGRQRLAMISSHGDRGLLVRELHYAADVRSFDVELPVSDAGRIAGGVREALLAAVEHRRRDRFDVSGYADPEPARLLAAVEKKIAAAASGAAPPATIHGAARERKKKAKGEKAVPAAATTEPARPPVKAPGSVRSLPTVARASDEEAEVESQRTRAPGA